ncbi:MarR family transcriptional regulator [Mycolicibacterium mucogenicum]|uniref:MarR family transcriptional regulator n=1 Tax=Mycolicibacterium mucogenicum TaxID=56689 RepID=A0A1A3GUN7_MYCMU|nr:MarR family transcriptional regulator [Mycolicibacterium mucogenicum]OBJ39540.1 MarR family transcriptional regulator [Mycolicibacterium mucogenicum]
MTVQPRTVAEPSVDAITDALVTASRLLLDITARAVAVVDDTLTVPQLRVLAILAAHGATNLTTLAAQLDVQPSTIGRMSERLVTAGLIERHQNPASRREIAVDLTRRGRAIVDTVSARRRAEIARIVEVMAPRERMGMVRALHAFSEAGGEPPAEVPPGLDF